MRNARSRAGFLAVLLSFGGILAAGIATGQLRQPNRGAGQTTNAFLPTPRSLLQQLRQAEDAIKEERFGDAVDRLGSLLAEPEMGLPGIGPLGTQDYFLRVASESGRQVSLKTHVRDLLGAMPAKGRELYELKFGADARQELQQAIEKSDFPQLLEVTRRYFHTMAGYQATLLAGRHYLDRGQPLAAALTFQRLMSAPSSSSFEPQLSVLLAKSWYFAQMPDRARETLQNLKSRDPNATIRIAGTDCDLFQTGDQAINWLATLVGDGFLSESMEADQWIMFRGDTARNAKSIGDFPLQHARWRVGTTNDPTDEQLIQQRRQQYLDQGIAALPSFHPLAVSGVVLMRTPRRLFGVDLETGKRVWNFPWFDTLQETTMVGGQSQRRQSNRTARAEELDQRVWDDAAFGQMSSDGRQVFLLWELGHASRSTQPMQVLVRPGGRGRPGLDGPVRFNKLAALDLKEQGKLRWIVGGENGTDDPKSAGFFFLGAPLPLMNQLYAMAEINSEIRLVVLDADTGQLSWSQQIAHVDMTDITQDPLRRLAGATPSFSDGVLVCPTSAGAVVAVDIANRSLLWGYQYPQQHPARGRTSVYRAQRAQIGDRWADATATIADGHVLLTPVESGSMYCLNLLTGELSWQPRPRGELLYTGCIHKGHAIMVGRSKLESIALSDGKTKWTLKLQDGMPSGRGIRTGNDFLLPTTSQQILKVNLDDGTIVCTHETEAVLGNLVAHNDQVLSQGVDWLASYHQAEPLRSLVQRRIEKDPNDIWALARQAELHLFDGNRTQAIEVLRQAHEQAPKDDSVRSLLVDALLSALRDDFATYRQFAADLERLIDQPASEAKFFRLMAVGLQAAKEYDQALEFYVKLASMEPPSPHGGDTTSADLVNVTPQLRVRHDRWIRAQLTKMFASADEAARERISRAIATQWDEAVATGSAGRLRRFVNQFGGGITGEQAQLQLAKQLIQHDALLEAELCLLDLSESSDAQVAGQATAILARLLQGAEHRADAAFYYQELTKSWNDDVLLDNMTGMQLVAQARSDSSMLNLMDPTALQWPYGKRTVEKTDSPSRDRQRYLRVYPIQLAQASGPFLENHRIAYNQSMNAILIRDRFGATTQQILLGDRSRFYSNSYSTSRVHAKGHLLILSVGFEVLAVDLLRRPPDQGDSIIWRRDLSNTVVARTTQRRLMMQTINRPWGLPRHVPVERTRRPIGLVGPITEHGVFFQKAQELTCADPLTGEPIWIRGGIPSGSDIFGDDEYLFVVGPTSNEAIVLSTSDGTELGRRPIPPRPNRWFSQGRHILTCQITGKDLNVRLFDTWGQTAIWAQRFDSRSQCWLVNSEEVAVMEPSGKLMILRIEDGAVKIDTALKPEPNLARLFVMPSKNDYIVIASDQRDNSPPTSPTGVRIFGPLGLDHCRLVNGNVYCFDRESGEPLWPGPAFIRQFSLPLDQPSEIPLLVMLRHVSNRTTGQTRTSSTTASLLCLDRRDGRQVLREDGLAALRSYSVIGNPTDKVVEILTNTTGFRIGFSDEPVPDQPPLQMEEMKQPESTLDKVRNKIKGTILDTFLKRKPAADTPAAPKPEQPAMEVPTEKEADPAPVKNPAPEPKQPEQPPDGE